MGKASGKNPLYPLIEMFAAEEAMRGFARMNAFLNNILLYLKNGEYSSDVDVNMGRECVNMFRELPKKEPLLSHWRKLPTKTKRYFWKKIVLLKTVNDYKWAVYCTLYWKANLSEGECAWDMMNSQRAETDRLKKRLEKMEKEFKSALGKLRHAPHKLN